VRPIFPAPLGLTLVAVIELPSDYEDGSTIPVEFTVTSPDDSEVYGRATGEVQATLVPGIDSTGATATVVLDLSAVPLTKLGVYEISGAISRTVSQSIYLHVVGSPQSAYRSQPLAHDVGTPGAHGS
jgi:hypothetical protein